MTFVTRVGEDRLNVTNEIDLAIRGKVNRLNIDGRGRNKARAHDLCRLRLRVRTRSKDKFGEVSFPMRQRPPKMSRERDQDSARHRRNAIRLHRPATIPAL